MSSMKSLLSLLAMMGRRTKGFEYSSATGTAVAFPTVLGAFTDGPYSRYTYREIPIFPIATSIWIRPYGGNVEQRLHPRPNGLNAICFNNSLQSDTFIKPIDHSSVSVP